jgi:sec-independent protein translocase protein TatB
MLDIGWTETMMIAVVVIVVVGPKDLPRVLRTFGRWVAKMRAMAQEFHRSLDDIAREADFEELRKTAEDAARIDLPGTIGNVMDPSGTVIGASDAIDASEAGAGESQEEPAESARKLGT